MMKSRIVAHYKMAVKTAKFCRIPKLWEHLSTVTIEVTTDFYQFISVGLIQNFPIWKEPKLVSMEIQKNVVLAAATLYFCYVVFGRIIYTYNIGNTYMSFIFHFFQFDTNCSRWASHQTYSRHQQWVLKKILIER